MEREETIIGIYYVRRKYIFNKKKSHFLFYKESLGRFKNQVWKSSTAMYGEMRSGWTLTILKFPREISS